MKTRLPWTHHPQLTKTCRLFVTAMFENLQAVRVLGRLDYKPHHQCFACRQLGNSGTTFNVLSIQTCAQCSVLLSTSKKIYVKLELTRRAGSEMRPGYGSAENEGEGVVTREDGVCDDIRRPFGRASRRGTRRRGYIASRKTRKGDK